MTTKKELDDIGSAWDLAKYRMEIAKEDLLAAQKLLEGMSYRIHIPCTERVSCHRI